MALYQLNRSEEGSYERSKEDSTVYLGEGDVNGLSLKDLVFITEADCLAPFGFSKKITVDFAILGKLAVLVPMPQHVDCIFSC